MDWHHGACHLDISNILVILKEIKTGGLTIHHTNIKSNSISMGFSLATFVDLRSKYKII
jgi:hypothetical protein